MNCGMQYRRRTLLAYGLAVAATPVLGACGRDRPEAPTITRPQVQDIQDAYAHQLFEAMRTRNLDLLRQVETDPLLDRDMDTIDLGDRLRASRTAAEFTLPDSIGYPVVAVTSSDQQQLITVSAYSNANRQWKDLALYVRHGETQPWLRSYGAGLYATDVPNFPHGRPLTPIAPDARGYLATPIAMPGIVAKILADPDSEQRRMFAASDVRQRYATTLATVKQQAAGIGTVTRSYRPGYFVIAIAVTGGYLALGTFDYDQTLTARAGRHITFKHTSIERRAFPGKYRRTTSSYGAMFAALVPKQGKITMVSGEERQTGLTVT
jgi:hypothetical protein